MSIIFQKNRIYKILIVIFIVLCRLQQLPSSTAEIAPKNNSQQLTQDDYKKLQENDININNLLYKYDKADCSQKSSMFLSDKPSTRSANTQQSQSNINQYCDEETKSQNTTTGKYVIPQRRKISGNPNQMQGERTKDIEHRASPNHRDTKIQERHSKTAQDSVTLYSKPSETPHIAEKDAKMLPHITLSISSEYTERIMFHQLPSRPEIMEYWKQDPDKDLLHIISNKWSEYKTNVKKFGRRNIGHFEITENIDESKINPVTIIYDVIAQIVNFYKGILLSLLKEGKWKNLVEFDTNQVNDVNNFLSTMTIVGVGILPSLIILPLFKDNKIIDKYRMKLHVEFITPQFTVALESISGVLNNTEIKTLHYIEPLWQEYVFTENNMVHPLSLVAKQIETRNSELNAICIFCLEKLSDGVSEEMIKSFLKGLSINEFTINCEELPDPDVCKRKFCFIKDRLEFYNITKRFLTEDNIEILQDFSIDDSDDDSEGLPSYRDLHLYLDY